jgi:hypothetical protein
VLDSFYEDGWLARVFFILSVDVYFFGKICYFGLSKILSEEDTILA